MKKIYIAILLTSILAHGATIAYVETTSGTEVQEWRTSTTTKLLDGDGDNIYGTYGAVQWKIGSTNQQSLGSATPGWGYVSGGSQFSGYNTQFDRVSGGADVGGSIVLTDFTFELTGISSTYTDKVIRVGIMADILNSNEWAADKFKAYQIEQTAGGSGNSGVISLRSGGVGNGVPEMYFFDISGAKNGDRFKINALNNQGGTSTQNGYLGSVSWDVYAVPETSSALLSCFGLIILTRRKR